MARRGGFATTGDEKPGAPPEGRGWGSGWASEGRWRFGAQEPVCESGWTLCKAQGGVAPEAESLRRKGTFYRETKRLSEAIFSRL
jgi:hypothetical protein